MLLPSPAALGVDRQHRTAPQLAALYARRPLRYAARRLRALAAG